MAVAVASWSLAAAEQEGAGNLRQPPWRRAVVRLLRRSCPRAETIVRDYVKDAIRKDVGIAAGLLRLHFHGAVQGCDASVLLDGSATAGVPGHRRLLLRHPRARRATPWSPPAGPPTACRSAAATARAATVQDVLAGLPAPTATVPSLLAVLRNINLDATDLVALSDIHRLHARRRALPRISSNTQRACVRGGRRRPRAAGDARAGSSRRGAPAREPTRGRRGRRGRERRGRRVLTSVRAGRRRRGEVERRGRRGDDGGGFSEGYGGGYGEWRRRGRPLRRRR
ncbi:hypothetical protein QYE76_022089 [Lolium multiflorum]|uniref:Plant heme peroxidase family profile domain-containing protein n=1 Tax=Lolium multiflorum TaxID=4521 RepID=A0AAD8RAB1_LOLMU|nr:hypothetical protein QYE76_022089 [Lolium multiflorum]